jgi:Ca2+-binding EF-hand superfamily protein
LLYGDEMVHLVPKEELARVVAEVDQNGDGEIDFKEF